MKNAAIISIRVSAGPVAVLVTSAGVGGVGLVGSGVTGVGATGAERV